MSKQTKQTNAKKASYTTTNNTHTHKHDQLNLLPIPSNPITDL
jgi:hypothetical protein